MSLFSEDNMKNIEFLKPTKIIKSKRKSISLCVKTNGDFIVRAPLTHKLKEINDFILKKSAWIIEKRQISLLNKVQPLKFDNTENINLLGKTYKVVCENVRGVELTEGKIIIPDGNPQDKLIKFLKKLAKSYIQERVEYYSKMFNFKYTSVSISSAKTCWGSCSYNNKLHFTYKLILCPIEIVDYIVVHELCHTKIKNHSTQFWELVKNCDNDYKKHEKWLKENRALVDLI